MMSAPDRRLRNWLRVIGIVDLGAFLALVQSAEALSTAHASLGMGTFPEAVIALYLARTASMLYGLCGVLLLFLSRDVARYRPVIRFIAICGVVAGPVLWTIDWTIGMPLWWTWMEGPLCSTIWGSVWWLSREPAEVP